MPHHLNISHFDGSRPLRIPAVDRHFLLFILRCITGRGGSDEIGRVILRSASTAPAEESITTEIVRSRFTGKNRKGLGLEKDWSRGFNRPFALNVSCQSTFIYITRGRLAVLMDWGIA